MPATKDSAAPATEEHAVPASDGISTLSVMVVQLMGSTRTGTT